MTHRDRLIELLRERSLEIGDFVLTSGMKSNYYVDCRRTTMHSEGQVLIGQLGWELLKGSGLDPESVGGLTMGADPVAYALTYTSWLAGDPVHAFSVRKQAKEHGKGKRIEGCFEPGQRVIVVEDVITTGGSALEACAAVEAEGGGVLAVLAVLDREAGGREKIEEAGYRVLSLLRLADLLLTQPSGSAAG